MSEIKFSITPAMQSALRDLLQALNGTSEVASESDVPSSMSAVAPAWPHDLSISDIMAYAARMPAMSLDFRVSMGDNDFNHTNYVIWPAILSYFPPYEPDHHYIIYAAKGARDVLRKLADWKSAPRGSAGRIRDIEVRAISPLRTQYCPYYLVGVSATPDGRIHHAFSLEFTDPF